VVERPTENKLPKTFTQGVPTAKVHPFKVSETIAQTSSDEAIAASSAPTVPGYQILSELGRGSMGVVYKAKQVGLNRIVALKMILAGAHAAGAQRARFRAEAEAIARLRHPNIVQIYDIGEKDGLPYFSLEYCDDGIIDDADLGRDGTDIGFRLWDVNFRRQLPGNQP
jgi:serine/threonine protein kinase